MKSDVEFKYYCTNRKHPHEIKNSKRVAKCLMVKCPDLLEEEQDNEIFVLLQKPIIYI